LHLVATFTDDDHVIFLSTMATTQQQFIKLNSMFKFVLITVFIDFDNTFFGNGLVRYREHTVTIPEQT
jgi:hypothetical protein